MPVHVLYFLESNHEEYSSSTNFPEPLGSQIEMLYLFSRGDEYVVHFFHDDFAACDFYLWYCLLLKLMLVCTPGIF